MDKFRYFKIAGLSDKDIKQIEFILRSKIFYPDFYSNPKLPETPNENFDYRQFFILINSRVDVYPIVYTREELTVDEFKEKIIPDEHWAMYYVDETPDIVGISENDEVFISRFDPSFRIIFTSYSYPQGDYREVEP